MEEKKDFTNEEKLVSALRWLLDDMTDAGENGPEGSKEEYDSVAFAREALREIEARLAKMEDGGSDDI